MGKPVTTSKPGAEGPKEVSAPPVLLEAGKLFQGAREIWIEHDGIRYRLRITRRNKLILQK
jgi:hemin uptake protein HemP